MPKLETSAPYSYCVNLSACSLMLFLRITEVGNFGSIFLLLEPCCLFINVVYFGPYMCHIANAEGRTANVLSSWNMEPKFLTSVIPVKHC